MKETRKVFVAGWPHWLGGAGLECWAAVKLWRSRGVPVAFLPTWHGAQGEFAPLVAALGCETYHAEPKLESLRAVPGLAGSVVVDFCNSEAVAAIPLFRKLDCSIIHAPLMTLLFPIEQRIFRNEGCPDAMVFQSNFQRSMIESEYMHGIEYNPTTGHLIRGAFDFEDWEFAPLPHAAGEPFVVGRAARPDCDKWSSNTWPIMSKVQYPNKRALMLGMNEQTHKKLGHPPDWAECLPPLAIPARDFYKRLHCCFPINGGARENWPRIILESFATGVPVVAQREWGIVEQIEHGVTGFLGSCDEELAHWVATLAWSEDLRMHIAENARKRLVNDLASPEIIWAGWKNAFSACGFDADERPTEATVKATEKAKRPTKRKPLAKPSPRKVLQLRRASDKVPA